MIGGGETVARTADRFSFEQRILLDGRQVGLGVTVPDGYDLEGRAAAVQDHEAFAPTDPSHDLGKRASELLGIYGSGHGELKLTRRSFRRKARIRRMPRGCGARSRMATRCYRPANSGFRFARNAASPSRASALRVISASVRASASRTCA